MGSVLLKPSLSKTAVGRHAALAPGIASFLAGFVIIFYLGMKGGGVEPVVRGEVGVAIWWVVLLGAAVGVLPRARLSSVAWTAVGLFAAFVAWNALGLTWTQSSEKTAAELARVAMHLGVLCLGLGIVRRGSVKQLVMGLAAAIVCLAWIALLSRLHPAWFPNDPTGDFLPEQRTRLTYPVNYWNGLAALIAIALPALLAIAATTRQLVVQAVAAAALPGMALAAYLTLSRGGAIEIAAALICFLVLSSTRARSLATLVPVTVGSLILIVGVTQRDALQNVDGTALAHSQGNEMLAMTLVVCAAVGLLQVAMTLTARFVELPAAPRRLAAPSFATLATLATVVLVVFLAIGGPHWLGDRWAEFKNPTSVASTHSRFSAAGGEGRYQYWKAALDASETKPLTGIGPGTYEFWWAEHGTLPGTVKHAHSLYFQTLAESGWIGLLLLLGFLGTVLYAGVRATRRARDSRPWLAAATAGCVAFCVSIGIDWTWELTVVPCTFLLLAAVLLAYGHRPRTKRTRRPERIALVGLSVVALGAIALPLLSARALADSQAAFNTGNVNGALSDAASAGRAEPYAATPPLQRALLLEVRHDYPAAVAAATKATRQEPTNWRTWLVLSRLEARDGNAQGALAAYRKAKSLNPRFSLFR